MESNDELKEIDIKNRTCYYLDDKIKIEGFDFNDIKIKCFYDFIQNFDWCKTTEY